LLVGGGVIGLSIARVLAGRGLQVTVIDQGSLGRGASWAGAGILPPANRATARHPWEQLRAHAHREHANWSSELLEETGIDNGYRPCGGLYFARTAGETAALIGLAHQLREEEIVAERLTLQQAVELEPTLKPALENAVGDAFRCILRMPDEAQIRNPLHLEALIASCRSRGVRLLENHSAVDMQHHDNRVTAIETDHRVIEADTICLTAGAWTGQLLSGFGVSTGILPIRGQMILFKLEKPPFRHVFNEGPRYLVARDDGHVLAGSTEEEVGFDLNTTAEGMTDLEEFAIALCPELTQERIVNRWAGLRPAAFDGFPYMGATPQHSNLFVAAGHYRSGLHLSPAVAEVMADLICGNQPQFDLTPFQISRG